MLQSNRENKRESKEYKLLLTATLRQYFSELNLQKITASVAASPVKFLDDPNGSKAIQAIQARIDDLTNRIRTEIEELCSKHNPSELIDEFVEIMVATQFPVKTIKAGEFFYRARIGRTELKGAVDDCNTIFILPYYGKDIGKPPALKTQGGRFNRAGQSFLYLSSDVETAIAEVHLQVGQECSVGKFKSVKDVDLIDLSDRGFSASFGAITDIINRTKNDTNHCGSEEASSEASSNSKNNSAHNDSAHNDDYYDEKLISYYKSVEESEEIIKFWRNFLLQPIYSDTKHKYLLTQFVTDAIVKLGVAGIYFNSIQAEGDNIVYFKDNSVDDSVDDNVFELVPFSERLYRADKIRYTIAEVEDGIRKWYKSPDYHTINSLNDDEEEKKEKEIDYLVDWIENERRERGISETHKRSGIIDKIIEEQKEEQRKAKIPTVGNDCCASGDACMESMEARP